MITLLKKDSIRLSILQTDFDVFKDISETFEDESIKNVSLIDLDNYVIPEYFKNKITIVFQSNNNLVGYVVFEFKNVNNIYQAYIDNLFIKNEFKNKSFEVILIEAVAYVAGEVGSRNIISSVPENMLTLHNLYRNLGFYEVGMSETGNLMSINVTSMVSSRHLNEKFRSIPKDSVNYKSLKLVKKITQGSSSNIYLTSDGQILKMFTSSSFTYIKDREETLKKIMELDIPEVIKPKKLVYYDGMFVGYIMEYLPDGEDLWTAREKYNFEDKIDKIKEIEAVMKKLHENKVYICDLNPNNIFFNSKGNIKLIDCDAFVVKNNIINLGGLTKYRDPYNKIVSEQTDLYAFAITVLELLTNIRIKNDANKNEVLKIYEKNKNKLPVSFKEYFDSIFNKKERFYLSDSYEKYINNMYNFDADSTASASQSGKVSVIIISIIMVIIAVVGYFVFKKLK